MMMMMMILVMMMMKMMMMVMMMLKMMMMAFRQIPTMTKSHHGWNMSVMDMVGFCHGIFPPLKKILMKSGWGISYIFGRNTHSKTRFNITEKDKYHTVCTK